MTSIEGCTVGGPEQDRNVANVVAGEGTKPSEENEQKIKATGHARIIPAGRPVPRDGPSAGILTSQGCRFGNDKRGPG